MEGLRENLSQPVAFATAPLTSEYPTTSDLQRNGSLSSDTDIEEPMIKRFRPRKGGTMGGGHAGTAAGSSSHSARTPIPVVDLDDEEFEDMFDEGWHFHTLNYIYMFPYPLFYR
jgi:hypothetical protein